MRRILPALFALALVCFTGAASATDITVRHVAVPGGSAVLDSFCANNLVGVDILPTGQLWTFSGLCGSEPPFNPPHDPNALTNITGRFASHTCGTFATNAGESFGSLFGMLEGGNAIISTWPFRPGTALGWAMRAGAWIYGGVFQMPANPGVTYHALSLASSVGCGLSITRAPIAWRVIGVGNTAAPTGTCSGVASPTDRPFVYLNPSTSAVQDAKPLFASAKPAAKESSMASIVANLPKAGSVIDNNFRCNLRPSGVYRVVLDPDAATTYNLVVWYT